MMTQVIMKKKAVMKRMTGSKQFAGAYFFIVWVQFTSNLPSLICLNEVYKQTVIKWVSF